MRIPDEKINEIRNATDIVEYIGMVVKLRKRGKNYVGLCPFHKEKTPSFNVSADKGMYYCFGCQRGGDVIKFAMEWNRASYVEAIEMLAERAGIRIVRTEESQSADELEKLYAACAFAGRFFYRNLTSTEEGKFALDYLHSRGFSDGTITLFGLGYSLRGWESLVRLAHDQGVSLDQLDKVGLIKKREDGTQYDTFRGRAMFPIFSPSGRVIAFGARKLYDDDPLGKYINSPETEIYHKSKILYGIHQAKEFIRERNSVVLVEGYADLISVFQAGIGNVVASSGTSLTAEQIQLIGRYTKNISLVYDADSAGAGAMMRGVDLILEGGLDVRIVRLPQGHDPDSFVRQEGGGAFTSLLGKAVTFIDFKANELQKEGKFDTPEGRAEAVRLLIHTIAKIKDPLKQSFFIKEVAEKYKLYESTLYAELERLSRKVPDRFLPSQPPQRPQSPELGSSAAHELPEIPLEEREILSAMLEDPHQLVPFVFAHLRPSDFSNDHTRKIASLVLEEFEKKGSIEPAKIIELSDEEAVKRTIADLSFSRYQLSKRWEGIGARESEFRLFEQAEGAIKAVKRRRLERELLDSQRKMKDAALNGEDTVPFMHQQREIREQIKEVEGLKLFKAEGKQ